MSGTSKYKSITEKGEIQLKFKFLAELREVIQPIIKGNMQKKSVVNK